MHHFSRCPSWSVTQLEVESRWSTMTIEYHLHFFEYFDDKIIYMKFSFRFWKGSIYSLQWLIDPRDEGCSLFWFYIFIPARSVSPWPSAAPCIFFTINQINHDTSIKNRNRKWSLHSLIFWGFLHKSRKIWVRKDRACKYSPPFWVLSQVRFQVSSVIKCYRRHQNLSRSIVL